MSRDDLFVNAHGVLIPERGLADQHFVDEDAQRPPVNRGAVPLVADYFRSEIFRRAAQGVSDAAAVVSIGIEAGVLVSVRFVGAVA